MPEQMSQDQLDEAVAVHVQVGSRAFELTRITWGDITAFEELLRNTRLKMFYEHIAEYSSDAQTQITLRLLRMPFSTQDVFDNMSSPTGVQWILLRSLQRKDQTITLEGLNLAVLEMEELSRKLLLVSGLIDETGKPKRGAADKAEADTPAT